MNRYVMFLVNYGCRVSHAVGVIVNDIQQAHEWATSLNWTVVRLIEVQDFEGTGLSIHDLRPSEEKLAYIEQKIRQIKSDLKINHGFTDTDIEDLLHGV